ncbi:MAG TPA: lantibiotic dehydratase, partial [Candidatus Sulfotelmatobacter sp.]|nr:lantibiotic dehydratase [Candidatus Sulfotelmatobacter sp.]
MLPVIKSAIAERERTHSQFEDHFTQCIEAQSSALQSFARDARFQEAVIWQNRHAFETAIQPALRDLKQSGRNQRQRNHELLIARYAQRYCVKNDSIGFFGPVVWARVEAGDGIFDLRPGVALIDRRQTYFESWAIDRCAASLSLIKSMDWWIPPRLAPDIFIENGSVHRPGSSPAILTELEQAVLTLCDGKHLPGEILDNLREKQKFRDIQKEEIHEVLQTEAGKGTLTWRFRVPVEVNAEINLHRQLLKIEDPELRASALHP